MLTEQDLMPGERLLLARRRQGITQEAAARWYRVPHGVYGRWERNLPTRQLAPQEVRLEGGVRPNEACLIYRLRHGLTQAQVAERTKYCRLWVRRMERAQANPQPLLDYWHGTL
jgi:transcriptional regulator with XRE-family HTH domain